ncbi:MAG TPA: hypothetical protein VGB98_25395 [Pyrinomonadaceae bacterium]|jgi:hypothetical protein
MDGDGGTNKWGERDAYIYGVPEAAEALTCAAPGCRGALCGRCSDCQKALCGFHFFSPAGEHGCVPVAVEKKEPGYKRGDELTIGGTGYRVIYAVTSTREGERQTLIVERLRGVIFYYRVMSREDGTFSAPVVIYE